MALPPPDRGAGRYDLTIAQGSTFFQRLTISQSGTAIDLTGVTAEAKIRENFADPTEVIALTVSVTDAVNGIIDISLTSAQTAALTTTQTSRTGNLGFWDLELTEGANVYRYLEGRAILSQEATK